MANPVINQVKGFIAHQVIINGSEYLRLSPDEWYLITYHSKKKITKPDTLEQAFRTHYNAQFTPKS